MYEFQSSIDGSNSPIVPKVDTAMIFFSLSPEYVIILVIILAWIRTNFTEYKCGLIILTENQVGPANDNTTQRHTRITTIQKNNTCLIITTILMWSQS